MKSSIVNVSGTEVQVQGKWIRIARVAEGYDSVNDPEAFVAALRQSGIRADLFTFIQHLSDPSPRFRYPMESWNFAALPVSTYDHWFKEQLKGKTRNMLRKAEKVGVTVREVPFDDALIAGIAEINNESPVRQGMRYWHYKDDLETVRRKNGTFLDRSVFIGVFFNEELIGYGKLVRDDTGNQAGLMQILSMIRHRDKAPNNMIIAQAVRSCAERGIPNLWYANFSYGKKQQDSLSDFKQNNGLLRIEVPRYYVPLTAFGRAVLQLRLHHGVKQLLPSKIVEYARKVRNSLYGRTVEVAKGQS